MLFIADEVVEDAAAEPESELEPEASVGVDALAESDHVEVAVALPDLVRQVEEEPS